LRYGAGITSDLRNVHGAIVVAGIEPSRIDVRRIQAKTDGEPSGAWRTPLVIPETPALAWGRWNVFPRHKFLTKSESYFNSRARPQATPLNPSEALSELPADEPFLDASGHRGPIDNCRLVLTRWGRSASLHRAACVFPASEKWLGHHAKQIQSG